MREIKFRGFSKSIGSFVYGFLQQVDVHGKTYSYIFWQGNTTEVDINSVGQFIGVKDKDGKEIYEGDLIKAKTVDVIHPQDAFKIKDEYLISSVYWDKYNFSFEADFNCFSFYDSKTFEVIGNIYENPELLQQAGS